MSKGDTRPPARSAFDDSDDSTAVVDRGPRRLRYPCRANNCPMPGTIFLGGGDGICAWHFGANGDELPRVTRVVHDWQPLADVVNDARTFSNDASVATSGKAQADAFHHAWSKLVPFVADSGWKQRVAPRKGELYGDWARRMERFLANRVKESLTGKVIADDDEQTPGVLDMRSRVRGGLKSPEAGWSA